MAIFVSYRREDAAGHAGRLCDDLADRFGQSAVFHDVDSIAPGADFLAAIRRAVASAEAVLVVIGPDWLTVTGEHGTPRLSDPADVVRLEVSAALETGRSVVPVLVGGATMPEADDLPADLATLARRNAVEIRAASWDEDTTKLARFLRRPVAEAPATPSRRRRWIVPAVSAAVLGGLALVGVLRPDGSESTISSGPTSSVANSTTTSARAPAGTPLVLPEIARTIVHPLNARGLAATVDAASLAPSDDGVEVRLDVELENRDEQSVFIGPTDLQLVADGRAFNPASGLTSVVGGRTSEAMTLTFPLPREPRELAVRLHQHEVLGEIPLVGPRAVPVAAPAVVAALAPVELGTMAYTFGVPEVEAFSDRHLVGFTVRAVNNGQYDDCLCDKDFRLLIDGAPHAPIGMLFEPIHANAAGSASLWWDLPPGSGPVVLRIAHGGPQADVPLTSAG